MEILSESAAKAGNKLLGTPPKTIGCQIVFNGKNNILMCEAGVTLKGGAIRFNGDNGVVILGKSKHVYCLDISVFNNCLFCMGRDCYTNGALHATCSEERYIVIGRNCLFSFGVWIRTADPHLVYDISSGNRINPSNDVLVGDNVWIGQDAILLKGTRIGSGSIVGAKSLVSKQLHSNASWGGVPARLIRDGVFWDDPCVHSWTSEKTERFMHSDAQDARFTHSVETVEMDAWLRSVRACADAEARLNAVVDLMLTNDAKNRFFIGPQQTEKRIPHVRLFDRLKK